MGRNNVVFMTYPADVESGVLPSSKSQLGWWQRRASCSGPAPVFESGYISVDVTFFHLFVEVGAIEKEASHVGQSTTAGGAPQRCSTSSSIGWSSTRLSVAFCVRTAEHRASDQVVVPMDGRSHALVASRARTSASQQFWRRKLHVPSWIIGARSVIFLRK